MTNNKDNIYTFTQFFIKPFILYIVYIEDNQKTPFLFNYENQICVYSIAVHSFTN